MLLAVGVLIAAICYCNFHLANKKEHYVSVYYDSSTDQIVIENQKANTYFYTVGGYFNIDRYPSVLPKSYYEGFEDRLFEKGITDKVYLYNISTDLPDGFYEIQVFLADIGYSQFDNGHSYSDTFDIEKRNGVLELKVYLGDKVSEKGPVYSTTKYILNK